MTAAKQYCNLQCSLLYGLIYIDYLDHDRQKRGRKMTKQNNQERKATQISRKLQKKNSRLVVYNLWLWNGLRSLTNCVQRAEQKKKVKQLFYHTKNYSLSFRQQLSPFTVQLKKRSHLNLLHHSNLVHQQIEQVLLHQCALLQHHLQPYHQILLFTLLHQLCN